MCAAHWPRIIKKPQVLATSALLLLGYVHIRIQIDQSFISSSIDVTVSSILITVKFFLKENERSLHNATVAWRARIRKLVRLVGRDLVITSGGIISEVWEGN